MFYVIVSELSEATQIVDVLVQYNTSHWEGLAVNEEMLLSILILSGIVGSRNL